MHVMTAEYLANLVRSSSPKKLPTSVVRWCDLRGARSEFPQRRTSTFIVMHNCTRIHELLYLSGLCNEQKLSKINLINSLWSTICSYPVCVNPLQIPKIAPLRKPIPVTAFYKMNFEPYTP